MVKINLQTRHRLGAITFCLLAAGCTDFNFRSEPVGRLQGSPRVQDLYQNRSPEVVRYDRYTLASIFDYIEVFYNRTRRHSHLGGVSPEAFEQTSS